MTAPAPRSFAGPLDFLLEEVRHQRVALEDIALAPLIAPFLAYIQEAAAGSLSLDIEWLHTAATLIHWKSRSLLPAPDPPPEGGAGPEDALRDALIGQLQAHRAQIREELSRRQAAAAERLSRVAPFQPDDRAEGEEPADFPFVSVWDLVGQARDLARWTGDYRKARQFLEQTLALEAETVTVEDRINWLRARLAEPSSPPIDGIGLLHEQPTAAHRASLFLGMLELARQRELHLEQDQCFGAIAIYA